MDSYFANQTESFFVKQITKFKDKKTLGKTDLEYIFAALLDLLGVPIPNSILYKHFLHPAIVRELIFLLNNNENLTPEDRFEFKDNFDELLGKVKVKKGNSYLQLRRLEPHGIYPSAEIVRNTCHYFANDFQPLLITKNNYSSEETFTGYSEMTWMTRNELKFSTCLLCSPEPDEGFFYCHFNESTAFKYDFDLVTSVPRSLRTYFLTELMNINFRFTPIFERYGGRGLSPDISLYEFRDFERFIKDFNKLYDAFSIRDHLLLRTSNYLVKSIMLWKNRMYGEEALANALFSIEGCLHLIQRKYGDHSRKLNRKLIEQVFNEKFPNGSSLFDFIQEGYEKRISIVHPEPNWGAKWMPFLMADDFYEYYRIGKRLMNFILIDRITGS